MEVIVAKNRGFCAGVKRAVDTALSVPPENTYVLGELIHNPEIVKKIAERGIVTVSAPEEVPEGASLLIRSHGAGREIYESCERRGIRIIDCTCPFVRRTQEIVSRAGEEHKTIIIAGEPDHPEVKGLAGQCKGSIYVFSSEEADFSRFRGKEVVLVSQTTFSEQRFLKIAKNLKNVYPKTLEIFRTICYTTVCRQKEAEKLAGICDAVLVIGGKNSSNTAKLSEIASAKGKPVFRLSGADDFKYENIENFKRVGIIAGASTPDWQTQEVLFKMAENNAEVQETTELVDETPETEEVAAAEETPETETQVAAPAEAAAEETSAPEAQAAAPAEAAAEETSAPEAQAAAPAGAPAGETSAPEAQQGNLMEKVVEDLGKNVRYKKGQIISANIVSATDEGIYVSASGKLEILLAKEDIDCEVYSREAYAARVGEEIQLMVMEITPKVKLSEKALKKIKENEALVKEIESGKEFSVVCTGFNKGGLTAEFGNYPVFIPASEIRAGYVKDLEKYKGKTLRLKLLEIRKERRKEIIASQRVILEAEKAAREAQKAQKEAEFFDSIHVDDIVEGKVERVTSFGAFVSVNGFDCLAHISDLSWTGVKEVTDVLTIGQRYRFKVLKVDREDRKVSIGYKQLQPQPWDLAAEKYAEGDVVHGKVVRIVPFGAFVEIEKGIDGLVHLSQISHEWLDNPTSVLSIGEEVDAKIIRFVPEEKKINLSIKALLPRPEPEPRHEREESASGNAQASRRPRKSNRRSNYSSDSEENDEYREWTEGGYGGASIADLLGGTEDDENK